jgi:hypothetical protein
VITLGTGGKLQLAFCAFVNSDLDCYIIYFFQKNINLPEAFFDNYLIEDISTPLLLSI